MFCFSKAERWRELVLTVIFHNPAVHDIKNNSIFVTAKVVNIENT